jgi:hypothetical protein
MIFVKQINQLAKSRVKSPFGHSWVEMKHTLSYDQNIKMDEIYQIAPPPLGALTAASRKSSSRRQALVHVATLRHMR